MSSGPDTQDAPRFEELTDKHLKYKPPGREKSMTKEEIRDEHLKEEKEERESLKEGVDENTRLMILQINSCTRCEFCMFTTYGDIGHCEHEEAIEMMPNTKERICGKPITMDSSGFNAKITIPLWCPLPRVQEMLEDIDKEEQG